MIHSVLYWVQHPVGSRALGRSRARINSTMNAVKDEEPQPNEPALLLDPEDYLESNESLEMNLLRGQRKVWLVKLPRYLADKWTKDQMRGQPLGQVKIRQRKSPGAAGRKLDVRLVLDPAQRLDKIPLEYNLQVLNTQVRNSYVFSEENLQRFQLEFTELGAMPQQPELKQIERDIEPIGPEDRYFRVHKNGVEDRQLVPFVKTIPKKTSLVGRIVHDCQVVPLKDDSQYHQMLMRRQQITQEKDRPKVTFLTEIPGVVQLQAGPLLTGRSTLTFMKLTMPRNKADGRAIRMPKKDLLDLLFRLFEEYEYWLMKGLKERTRQPETYLKESLESIANLIKKGPYTLKYNLKPEYRRLRDARLGHVAQQEEKDDDDDEMEDII